jgi:hypothetical protein
VRRPLLAFGLLLALSAAPAQADPQLQATLTAGTVETGATVTLVVAVLDPSGGTGEPQFSLPPGLSVLGSEQGQNFAWVNGHSTNRTEYRYAIGTDQPGRYSIGPIRVRVGKQVMESPVLTLVVTAGVARHALGARSAAGASLLVELRPQRPYVGQLTQLSLRLVQTSNLGQSGPNSTPSTTGFWTEGYGAPIEYRANVGGRSAIVTERRVRIYPLAPGPATVGSASLLVVPARSSQELFDGAPAAPPVEVRSESVRVNVQPLPGGAPAGFNGGVGQFTTSWGLDRGHAAQDQAITLHLDVRGTGSLPLLRTPALTLADFEVFSSTVDDSFPPAGEVGTGRRRFLWTMMPRRSGELRLSGPAFAWFDPVAEDYRVSALAPLSVSVLAVGPGSAANADADAFPAALAHDTPRPGSRPARPWVFAIAGALLGLAVRLWRRTSGPDPDAAERARQREWLRAVGLARGPDFWQAADESAAWVERRGGQVLRLREEISAARYGGKMPPEDDVRRRLVERIGAALPASPSGGSHRALAAVLTLVALAGWLVGSGAPANEGLVSRVRAADAMASARRTGAAAEAWEQAWRDAPGDPAIAARLGWAALGEGHIPEATAWELRGRAGEARSGALGWTRARLREAGALVGAPGTGVPLRSIEWAALAFALALGGLLEWPRRWSPVLLALAASAALWLPVQRALAARTTLAVVRETTPLAGADLDLDAGQVVRVLSIDGTRARVSAGRELAGDVDRRALLGVREARP